MEGISIGIIIAAVIAVLIIILLAAGYVKAPPNKAYIISGMRKRPKILIGRAGFRIPFLERMNVLYLNQITIDIKTDNYIPTLDYINVQVDAVAKVRINSDSEEMMLLAMKNFLDKKPSEIVTDLQDSLQGNMREIIGTLDLKTICNNRDEFSNQVQEKASVDMMKLGIEIISCNIQNVEDEHGLIQDMGMDNTSKIKKDAAIAKANSEKEIAIAQAEADKLSNDARVISQTEIAKRNNELAIRQSELKKEADTVKAEADMVYQIRTEDQRKTLEITRTNADIAKQEREIELKQKEASVREQQLNAEVKKKADAMRYEQEQKAQAELFKRQKDAEAARYEQEQEAEAQKARAEAMKFEKEQTAEGIRLVGQAEAQAIEAKGKAEAEAMEKKAEAYSKYNKAAMAEMLINILPEMAGRIAEPLAQIDKIVLIGGGDDGSGVSQIAGNVPAVLTKVMEAMKETTGVDLAEIMRADTYDAKVNKNINFTGFDGLFGKEKDKTAEAGKSGDKDSHSGYAKEGKTEAEEKAAAATEAVKGMMKDVVKDVRDAFNKDKK
ncbi:flotillin family protein [Murimonas intestini]|uniref:Flotillin n=1 Tax=Murimonas intestini TaxID=1337051 RepID=A0AB73T251_9FIRM|nr:SPFH domain-containing protein [Murimonas intestini]MCR1843470.1 SPFH domain-containing protein [Murimonas intestini]MCR1868802.1 SPFH domain-containing protein [Murimonas intestini]MCR1886396.1 SPFH domain-containing protein [Murimonas intestini]